MPDDTATTTSAEPTSQGDGGAEPQGGAVQDQGSQPQDQGSTGTRTDTQDIDALTARIAVLERENGQYRDRERERKRTAPDAEVQAQRITDLEAELATVKTERRTDKVRLASVTAAQRLGYRNPDLAVRLLDPDAIDFDKDGNPRNVDRLLSDIAKADPYLVSVADFGGGRRGEVTGQDFNATLRRAAGRST